MSNVRGSWLSGGQLIYCCIPLDCAEDCNETLEARKLHGPGRLNMVGVGNRCAEGEACGHDFSTPQKPAILSPRVTGFRNCTTEPDQLT